MNLLSPTFKKETSDANVTTLLFLFSFKDPKLPPTVLETVAIPNSCDKWQFTFSLPTTPELIDITTSINGKGGCVDSQFFILLTSLSSLSMRVRLISMCCSDVAELVSVYFSTSSQMFC